MTEQKKDIYDILRDIVELLKTLSEDEQNRVIRWASEMLNIKKVPTAIPQTFPAQTETPQTPIPQEATNQIPPNIKSFVESKNPISDSHFATTVAYFYQFEATEKKDSISKDDLVEATRLAGRKRLKNPNQTLVDTTRVGYLDNISRGQYRLNSVGENLVAMVLPNTDKPVSVVKTKKKTNAKAKPKPKPKKGGK